MTNPEDADLRDEPWVAGGQAAAPEPEAEPEPEPYPFWGWKDVLLLTALVLPLLVVSFVVITAFFHFLDWAPRIKALAPIAATFFFYGLWFALLYELIRIRYGRPFWRSLAWVRPPGGYPSAASWGVLLAFFSVLLAAALRTPPEITPMEQLLQDPISIVLLGFFAVTLGPLAEELAFRGFLMPLMIRSLGVAAGIALTAAPFALLHGAQYAWSWQRLVVIFIAGSAFGWMRYRSGSTAAATLMHATYNLTFFIGLLAQRLR